MALTYNLVCPKKPLLFIYTKNIMDTLSIKYKVREFLVAHDLMWLMVTKPLLHSCCDKSQYVFCEKGFTTVHNTTGCSQWNTLKDFHHSRLQNTDLNLN